MGQGDLDILTSEPTQPREVGDVAAWMDGLSIDLQPWVPGVDEVAAILRGRTADSNGRTGTFTADTKPTDEQVGEVILDAIDEVTAAVPWPLPDAPGGDADIFRKAWRRITALLAAMNVELAFPSANGGTARYDRLEKRQDAALKRLIEAVAESGQGGGGESVESPAAAPTYTFDTGPLVGPRTVY